ncbi:hypothetical protein PENTCL1PPCAC_26093, partial [Pristionchus entomophagus]
QASCHNNRSPSMLGGIIGSVAGAVGNIFGGGAAKEKAKAEAAVARTKYEGAMLQAERDREANEKLMELQKEAANKLQDAFHEAAAAEKRAHEGIMNLEKEKSAMMKETADATLVLVQEGNERQRIFLKEADEKRHETEKIARETETRLREENEQKRDKERLEARQREDR